MDMRATSFTHTYIDIYCHTSISWHQVW